MARLAEVRSVGSPIWGLQRASELARAVGRVSLANGKGFGTGFLVAPRVLLTCYHVVPDVITAESAALELDYFPNQEGLFAQVQRIELDPAALYVASRDLDFALIGLRDAVRDRAVIPLVPAGQVAKDDSATLFHHPQAGPLRMERGVVLDVKEQTIWHALPTEPGSAGAPLLDEQLRLAGVHHRVVIVDGAVVANEAIRTTAILAELQKLGIDAADLDETRVVATTAATFAVAASRSAEVVDTAADPARNTVFISYAHDDQADVDWREKLRVYLTPLVRAIDVWDDSRIRTGADWRAEIDLALRRARVAVLLVGPHFLASDFIANHELPPLLEAVRGAGIRVMPLITNDCSYARTELHRFQSFNDPDEPLELLPRPEQNKSLRRFAEEIADAFQQP